MGAVVYAETFGNPSEVWMWRQVRALGVPLLTHEHRNAATFPYERAVARKLEELGATVLHAHYGPAGLRMLALLVTFHGFDTSSLPRTDPSYRRALHGLFARAASIIAVSETVRGRLVGLGCPEDRLHVIPLGVPVAPPRPRAPPSVPSRSRATPRACP